MWLAKLVTLGVLCLPSVAGQVTVVMDVTITDFFPPLTEESQVRCCYWGVPKISCLKCV